MVGCRVAITPGDDQDHPAAEGTMVLVLSVVVPWAFRNAKAFQGIDQEAGEAKLKASRPSRYVSVINDNHYCD